MVGSAEEARRILHGMKYVPVGRRGVALGIAHDRYLPGPTMEKLAEANRKTTLFAQIETREGVQNADAIAAVDGVDCLWVGHFDLSCSLGIPGQFDHKDFTDAIATVAKACKRHQKSLGRLVPTVDDAVALHGQGFDFICYSGDVWALYGAVNAGLSEIRQRTAKSGAAKLATAKPAGKGKAKAKGGAGKKKK
jgi:2-keto-3-deoxy-L-rhamnonate aldolase RhmA